MLERPQAVRFDYQPATSIPAIDEDGRIKLPGVPAGLSIQAYLPLVHTYANVLEASRILDRYRTQLRLPEAVSMNGADVAQAPLTALTPSTVMSNLVYKREDRTVTRAYKVRGAVGGMAQAMARTNVRRFLTVSTGNHALGVLKAAELLRPESVRLVVPVSTPAVKLAKLKAALNGLNATGVQADSLFRGKTFDQAKAWALASQQNDEAYLDPYSDPWVVAGQGTLGLELLAQIGALLNEASKADAPYEEVVVIAPIGGGGLLTGTATALRMASAWDPAFRNVNLRFVGLRLSELDAPLGDAIRVAEMAPTNARQLEALAVNVREVSNAHMAEGVAFVQADLAIRVEGASGGTLFPVLHDSTCCPTARRLVVCLLSGGNC